MCYYLFPSVVSVDEDKEVIGNLKLSLEAAKALTGIYEEFHQKDQTKKEDETEEEGEEEKEEEEQEEGQQKDQIQLIDYDDSDFYWLRWTENFLYVQSTDGGGAMFIELF